MVISVNFFGNVIVREGRGNGLACSLCAVAWTGCGRGTSSTWEGAALGVLKDWVGTVWRWDLIIWVAVGIGLALAGRLPFFGVGGTSASIWSPNSGSKLLPGMGSATTAADAGSGIAGLPGKFPAFRFLSLASCARFF